MWPGRRLAASVWRDIPNTTDLSGHDSFFELAGSSPSLVAVQATLRERMRVELAVVELFQNATVSSLIETVEHRHASRTAR